MPAAAPAVDKSTERVRRMFGAIAGRYDLMNRLMTGGLDVLWRRRISRADLGAGPALDCCTGTGDLAFALRKRRPDLRVVGADFTHQMLAEATRKDRRGEIAWVEGDGEALPFADAAFTAVSVGFGLRNVADTRRGLAEFYRVLAPGGVLLILETSRPTNPLLAPLFKLYFRGVVPVLGRWAAGNPESAYDYLPASAAVFPDGEELCDLFREAGFADCNFQPLGFGAATFYTARKP
ncbi:ubiquinone/menaquinone biosynthesis methyltransferase [Alienimonas californiensis]|uniref:Demethylmenaquinone methyltransferase n=1 Tax=Alienimonas californiensis TaxID=2527989 RepID=A0A517PFM4_9PLAN|nr:ubiquinone/menaquinone biosynthesis methyltransferase [Alienimonas californiensis]QDT18197.1 UbiE/COQ5 methyltransferase [Alienimonas californiensis]